MKNVRFLPMDPSFETAAQSTSRCSALLLLTLALTWLGCIPAMATINIMTNGTSLSTAANWSLGSGPNATANPGSFTDLLLNSPSTNLVTTSGTIHGRSWNVTNGSTYSVAANSTQLTPQVRSGTTSSASDDPFTNDVSGVGIDLVYLINNSALTIYRTNANPAGGGLTFKLMQAGNFNIATGSTLTVYAPIDTSSTINKNGEGAVILSGTNNYTGTTKINAGTVQANGAPALSTNSTLSSSGSTGDSTVLNLGTADNGYTMKALSIGGIMRFTGPSSGSATLTFNGAAAQGFTGSSATKKISVATNVNVVVNGTNFDLLGAAASTNREHTLEVNGTMTFNNSVVATGSPFVAGFSKTGEGTLVLSGTNTYSGATKISAGTLQVSSPAALSSSSVLNSGSSTADSSLLNLATASGGYAMHALSVGGIMRFTGPSSGSSTVTFAGGAAQGFTGGAATKKIFIETNASVVVNGSAFDLFGPTAAMNRYHTLEIAGAMTFNAQVTDTGGAFTSGFDKTGLGVLTLAALNDYNGETTVSAGTLLVNGSITGGNVVVDGGILGGTGTIKVPVTVTTNGILSPGASIGTLTISNTLSLSGETVMELNHSSADKVTGIGSLTLGGTLTVLTNGPAITGGESFQLFSATSYSGDFTNYNLPVLPSPLNWNVSAVLTTGTLTVTGAVVVPNPIPLIVAKTNNVLTFSWTNAAFVLQSQTNSLSLGLKTNWFDYPGGASSPVNVTIDVAKPTVFFRLKTP